MPTFDEQIRALCEKDPRFSPDTYAFVYEVIDFTMKASVNPDAPLSERTATHHVTARQLLDGLHDYALQEFGPMARLTLKRLGLASCSDFGDTVFNLVNSKLLITQSRDKREDFNTGYDFETAFSKPFRPASLRKQNKRN